MGILISMPLAKEDREKKPHPQPLSEERGEYYVRDWRVIIA